MKDFIIGIICGACLLLTAWNTYKLMKKPKHVEAELTTEEKRKRNDDERDQKEWEKLMSYQGRNR
jgi:hypothetical protein